MEKIRLLLLVILCVGYGIFTYAADDLDEASKYQYNDNDPPTVCFFPAEKARWSGFGVTTNDWEKLTAYQKTMFITEGIEEIKRIEAGKVVVNVQEEAQALLTLTNERVSRLQVDFPGLDVGMIKFLRDMLHEMGKIKE